MNRLWFPVPENRIFPNPPRFFHGKIYFPAYLPRFAIIRINRAHFGKNPFKNIKEFTEIFDFRVYLLMEI
jgi:hypothetical protein